MHGEADRRDRSRRRLCQALLAAFPSWSTPAVVTVAPSGWEEQLIERDLAARDIWGIPGPVLEEHWTAACVMTAGAIGALTPAWIAAVLREPESSLTIPLLDALVRPVDFSDDPKARAFESYSRDQCGVVAAFLAWLLRELPEEYAAADSLFGAPMRPALAHRDPELDLTPARALLGYWWPRWRV